ncbi:MAG: ABC transporter permease [Eubacteriales bacterium]|jgi:ABC-2 type transport system permease protein|nr:ABC transporter permease [Eubacteriales bacterium]MDD3198479.1 ABC transporter permease [Eubacteriales bacterium]MDD3504217.1 ABC transporter permease [Eubacteriales bacterium]MDD4682028.1 ABC transporter permease [Eubacteriales bacterium]
MNRQFFTVMKFEFMTYLRNKVYVGITLAVVILMAIGLSLPAIISTVQDMGVDFSSDDEPTVSDTIYVVDKTGQAPDTEWFAQLSDTNLWETATEDKIDEIKTRIDEKNASGLLIINEADDYTWVIRRMGMMESGMPAQFQTALGQYYRALFLSEQGLDETAIMSALQEPQLEIVEIVEESGKSMEQTYFYTYLLLFLLYMTVMMYGQLVATSVASEKSNRAMEMLITSAKPMNLMFGKVIGSGLAGLAQISVMLITAGVFYKINEAHLEAISIIKSVFSMPPQIIFYTILFYITGYFVYAFLYGALGSLASRTEDINTSIMPIILIFMVAFFIAFYGMMSPETPLLTVASFIPFVSPMAMFVRISMTEVPIWQIVVSVALMFATIWGTGWLAAKIYRIGILMYGKPPKIKDLAAMLRNAR